MTSAREKAKGLTLGISRERGVSTKDLAVFTRQFSTMINSGLPLVQCLDILGKQAEKDHFRKLISQTMRDVEAGSTLADALSRHPAVFTDLYVNMVEAGEAGGVLDVILARLASYLEKMDSLKPRQQGPRGFGPFYHKTDDLRRLLELDHQPPKTQWPQAHTTS